MWWSLFLLRLRQPEHFLAVYSIVSLVERSAQKLGSLLCGLLAIFRFNRRLSTHRGKLFYRLMQQAVTVRPPTVKALYASKPQPVGDA